MAAETHSEVAPLVVTAAALGALLVLMLFVRAVRTFVGIGVSVVAWLVIYEQYKDSLVGRTALAGLRAVVTRTVDLMIKWATATLST